MSTEIEFRHLAICLSPEGLQGIQQHARHIHWAWQYTWREPHYLVFVEHGSSNTVSSSTGKIARAWSLYAAGSAYDCMRVPIRYADGVHGGSTRLRSGRTLPETYIAHYRKVLAKAVHQNSLATRGLLSFALAKTWRAPESFTHCGDFESLRQGGHPLTSDEVVLSRIRLGRYSFMQEDHHEITIPIDSSPTSSMLLWWLVMSQSDRGTPTARLTYQGDHGVLSRIEERDRASAAVA